MNRIEKHYSVAIVGGGIIGGALAKVVTQYTDIPTIALFEMSDSIGNFNSHVTNNSGTLHDGSIEHYNRKKSESVKEMVGYTSTYFERHLPKSSNVYRKGPKLLIGVDDEEYGVVTDRYNTFKDLYPGMELITASEIAKREPFIMKGRNPNQPIIAIANEGYTVDFGLLARQFVLDAMSTGRIERHMNTRIMEREITRIGDKYLLTDARGRKFTADVVIFAAGAYSLSAAKALGLGTHLGILSIFGNYYYTNEKLLNGKGYTVQDPNRPNAAIHADAEMHSPDITRFGPTAIVLPILADGDWSTFVDYLRVSVPTWKGIKTLASIVADPKMAGYILHNMAYQIPFVGKELFAQSARKIIPTLKASQLRVHHGKGIRAQIVNTLTGKLELGDTQVVGHNIICNNAPSPGASVALGNGLRDTKKIIEFFGGAFSFNEDKWNNDYR